MADTTTATEAAPAPTEDAAVASLATGLADGPVTFTRPGIESREFKVKGDKFTSITQEDRDWLLRHVIGTTPETDQSA